MKKGILLVFALFMASVTMEAQRFCYVDVEKILESVEDYTAVSPHQNDKGYTHQFTQLLILVDFTPKRDQKASCGSRAVILRLYAKQFFFGISNSNLQPSIAILTKLFLLYIIHH